MSARPERCITCVRPTAPGRLNADFECRRCARRWLARVERSIRQRDAELRFIANYGRPACAGPAA